MVATTASTPHTTTHRINRERAYGYRWVAATVILAGLITLAAVLMGGSILWFQAGICVALAFTSWVSTKAARRDAREFAALRAEFEKERN